MDNNSYEVGYGRPPKRNQFKKGQSGNLKGRPKQAENIYGTIKRALEEKVTVKIAGRTRSITKMEAAFVQLSNKAVSGDIRALREVIRLREKLQEKEPYLNNGPNFIVNFIDPKTKRPVGEKT
ncbi:DUF5681 domain-containing protein [Tunturiibacter gelidoferens]|uniref:Uncharacterized protein n=1 Tax=Tunturiibacter gelidiferens TaxID=3069689 RepID=A0ACC5NTE0_9BACT|nr:hypothetical protein [Edaphobacter lichenicola]